MNSINCLIIGDSFLRKNKIKFLIAEIEKDLGGEVDRQSFNLEETSLSKILESARTLPFLVNGQIFFIQKAESLNENDLSLLSLYLNHPSMGSYLIFETDNMNEKDELVALLRAKGKVWTFSSQEMKSASSRFISDKINQFAKKISPKAQARILEMCGDELVFLDTMLDRLIQYSGENQDITEDMVDLFEENWQEANVYQLTNAILMLDKNKALNVFRELVDFHRTDLVALIGLLHWQLKQLWQARVLMESGASEKIIIDRCRISKKRASFFLKDLKKFSLEKLELALESLYIIDKGFKTGRIEGDVSLEGWLLQLTS